MSKIINVTLPPLNRSPSLPPPLALEKANIQSDSITNATPNGLLAELQCVISVVGDDRLPKDGSKVEDL